MADQDGKLRQVDWNELLPWLILLRTIRVALMARVLILGAVGLIVVALGWQALGTAFADSNDKIIQHWQQTSAHWIWQDTEFAISMSANNADELFSSAVKGLYKAPVSLWLYLTRPFVDMFNSELTWVGFIYMLLCGIWELLVWGIVGGAITRIAALRLTRNEAPGLVAAVAHAGRKWMSYSLAPLVALGGAAVFAVQLLILGFVMRLDVLAMVAGILWPFVLMLGLLMAILLLGALVGWPLMWATVSVEGTDAFDALSRGYAYTYQRPLRLLWYVVFAAILAAVSMFVVKLFAASAIALGDWSISWGVDRETMHSAVALADEPAYPPAYGLSEAPAFEPTDTSAAETTDLPQLVPPTSEPSEPGDTEVTIQPAEPAEAEATPAEPGWMVKIAAGAIYFWKSALAALAAGYQAGFLWVAAVGVYLLLRRDIDGAEMDEVFLEQQDDYGMPTLSDDTSTGVPEVVPGEAQAGDGGEDGNDEPAES